MSNNFDFLQTVTDPDYLRICAKLYKVCTGAEISLYRDPDDCMNRCRIAAELVAQLLYFKLVGDYGRKNFFEILDDNDLKVKVHQLFGNRDGKRLLDDFHQVRKAGNKAHHGKVIKNPVLAASKILQRTHRLIVKTLKKLGLVQTVPSYTEPNPYTEEVGDAGVSDTKVASAMRTETPRIPTDRKHVRKSTKTVPLEKQPEKSIHKVTKRKLARANRWLILSGCLIVVIGFIAFFPRSSEEPDASLPGWGPERETYTNDAPANHATFNSITNNELVGDERDFVRIEEKNSGRPYSSDITIEADRQYEVYIYYRNDASEIYNDEAHGYAGVAYNTKLSSNFPTELEAGEKGGISAVIRADNSNPESVWDAAHITAAESVTLHYVEGSAKIYNSWEASGSTLPISMFSEEGTFLGLNELNGVMLGGEDYSGCVVYTIQTYAAEKTYFGLTATNWIIVIAAIIITFSGGLICRVVTKRKRLMDSTAFRKRT